MPELSLCGFIREQPVMPFSILRSPRLALTQHRAAPPDDTGTAAFLCLLYLCTSSCDALLAVMGATLYILRQYNAMQITFREAFNKKKV